ncbi:uncharacterized protein LOC143282414 [Babylonia areolata]|uniref:uncharacterized protein LOC143282414 n=1 Tax=Babylonia areolata TaxID=304850 RepID=UPI003FD07FE3
MGTAASTPCRTRPSSPSQSEASLAEPGEEGKDVSPRTGDGSGAEETPIQETQNDLPIPGENAKEALLLVGKEAALEQAIPEGDVKEALPPVRKETAIEQEFPEEDAKEALQLVEKEAALEQDNPRFAEDDLKEPLPQVEQKIRQIPSIQEENVKEAMSLVKEYRYLFSMFTKLVQMMIDIKSDPQELVKQLDSIEEGGEPVADFFALIGGTKATLEIFDKQLEGLGFIHLPEELPKDKEEADSIRKIQDFLERETRRSEQFAAQLTDTDLFTKHIVKYLNNKLQSDPPCRFAEVSKQLTLFQNCARNRELQQRFLQTDAVELLSQFCASGDEGIILQSLLTLSFIIKEDEGGFFFSDWDLGFLLNALSSACNRADHKGPGGQSLEGILQGLGCLALIDDYKGRLVKGGILSRLKHILDTGSDEEKQEAAQIIWQLSFEEKTRAAIKKDKELLKRLKKLKNGNVAKTCEGALWVLEKEDYPAASDGMPAPVPHSPPSPPPPSGPTSPPPASPHDDRKGKGHVMISYQWKYKKPVQRIKKDLEERGYRVWIDDDQMTGSIDVAMAQGVEGAEAFLMCMSQGYFDSNNCHSEAGYARQTNKPIIPLKMQKDFEP